jgi:hypothetical protein
MLRVRTEGTPLEVVSLAEAKEWLSVDYPDWDDLIQSLIQSSLDRSQKVSGSSYWPVKVTVTGNKACEFIYPIQPVLVDAQGLTVVSNNQKVTNQVFEYDGSNTVTLDFAPSLMLYVGLNGQLTDRFTLVGDQLTVTDWEDGYIIVGYEISTAVTNDATEFENYTYVAGFIELPSDLKRAVLQRVATGFAERQNGLIQAMNKATEPSLNIELAYRPDLYL